MTTVLKFGSSVLPTESDVPGAVHEIYRWVRRGEPIIAIVSAIGRTTDRLLAQARQRSPEPTPHELARHLATGEEASVRLLTAALSRAGIPCEAPDPSLVGPFTEGDPLAAEPVGLDIGLIRAALARTGVVVLPGFIGRDAAGRTTLLGRGGSDLSAVFIAHRLRATRCRLIKDVDGIYTGDPNAAGPAPERFRTCHWSDAAAIGGRIVQRKAVEFAHTRSLPFEVAALGGEHATIISGGRSVTESPMTLPPPLRVGLLGLGTVGLGVYQRLLSRPDLFEVVRIAVRDRARHPSIPPDLLTTDPWRLADDRCHLVIEAIHGLQPAAAVLSACIDAGADAITANKVIASSALALRALAARRGRRFLHAAAVGGAMPAIEAVERLAQSSPIRSLRAILNTTSSFIAQRLARGESFDSALRKARALGLAEEDAHDDLSGRDAARKLAILARAAFGLELDADRIPRDEVSPLIAPGLRPIATLSRDGTAITAAVRLERPAPSDPLALAEGALNILSITLDDGSQHIVRGTGAGRWPTTEAVLADAMDIARARLEREPAAHAAALPA